MPAPLYLTLPVFNSTSWTAQYLNSSTYKTNTAYPVGWSFSFALLLVAYAIWYYWFPIITFRYWGGHKTDNKKSLVGQLVWNVFVREPWILVFSIWVWSVYIGGYLPNFTLSHAPVYSPQDVFYITQMGFCALVLMCFALVMLLDFWYAGNDGTGVIKPWGAKSRNFFLNYPVLGHVIFLPLFPAIYGYAQVDVWSDNPYLYDLPAGWGLPAAGLLGSGILLGVSAMVHLSVQFTRAGAWGCNGSYVKTSSNLFCTCDKDASKSDAEKSFMKGWIPVVPLPKTWVLSYIFFIGPAYMLLTHDMVKGIVACVLSGGLALALSLAGKTFAYFYSYHIVMLFALITFSYFTMIMNPPLNNSTANLQVQANFGLFTTGPALTSDLDLFTFQFFSWLSCAFSIITTSYLLFDYGYCKRDTLCCKGVAKRAVDAL